MGSQHPTYRRDKVFSPNHERDLKIPHIDNNQQLKGQPADEGAWAHTISAICHIPIRAFVSDKQYVSSSNYISSRTRS
jgi:hypothetical protein